MRAQRYIPALGHRWLDRFYDPLLRWTMPEGELKTALSDTRNVRLVIKNGKVLLKTGVQ